LAAILRRRQEGFYVDPRAIDVAKHRVGLVA
jgi:hypothetical protein